MIERVGGSSTSADPPPQLMQLRQTKAFGMVDHHHTGFRDIDAHLHDGGRDEALAVASLKSPEHRLLVCAAQAAVQQAHREVGEDLCHQFRMDIDCRAQVELFGFLNERQHHIGTLSFLHLRPDQAVGLLSL